MERFVLTRALLVFALGLAAVPGYAQYVANRYMLVLEDAPVAAQYIGRASVQSAGATTYRQQLLARQRTLRAALAAKKIEVTSSVDTLLNGLFVVATPDRAAELKSLPGVKGVVRVRQYKPLLSNATQLVNAPAAWNAAGGVQNAGAGMKIAILDTGIDQTHPAFQDSSLSTPSGFPKCSGTDCNFTTNKVIAARSYASLLAAGSSAADTRPDDYTPRDRVGHGTAAASCAAGSSTTGLVPVIGVAPKAFLGNYKIYGSPGVNDGTTDEAIVAALDDAVKDGMDVISFSTGGPAGTGPLDTGAACGKPAGVACDISAMAFENAAQAGATIVVSAGNEGYDGNNYPAYGTIGSPADAPSVIAVGAVTNSHYFVETLDVPGGPGNLQGIFAEPGDAHVPWGAITAPLVDITTLGDNGLACAALPDASLVGAIALIQRGTCDLATKMDNVTTAGALAAIVYMANPADVPPSNVLGFSYFSQTAIMIYNSDGIALKNYIAQNPGHVVKINPSGKEQTDVTPNQIAYFSSRGPSTGDSGLKPEIVAPGRNMYMAAQSYDPAGALYSSDRYLTAGGTSFSAPMVSGAAALVKQQHPGFTAAQIKSALVNTASQDVTQEEVRLRNVDIRSTGGGKLDVGAAAGATVTIVPSTISFGVPSTLPITRTLSITNAGSAPQTLTLAVSQTIGATTTTLSLDRESLTLAAGANGNITVTLGGSAPAPGLYYGVITVQGTGVSLRVPYQFVVGDGYIANLIPLAGDGFIGTVNSPIPSGVLAVRVVDQFGAPVANASVLWSAPTGGSYSGADTQTDAYGIAYASPVLGSSDTARYSFPVAVTDGSSVFRHTFSGYARLVPSLPSNGVVNAASFEQNKAVAPGSYIAIFGSALSDYVDRAEWVPLPMAIDDVNVTFDVPAAGISVPGHLLYVSPTQINLQVPWELQGQTSVQMKVVVGSTYGNVITIPLADYSPAFFLAGNNQVAALDGNFKLISSANPVSRGGTIILYANGLGPTNNQPGSGDPAPLSTLATTRTVPAVSIGGQSAPVDWAGLVPGYPGLYQINAKVPSGVSAGTLPITVAIGGLTSPQADVVVQ